jgi:class 3 adenylate cyclase
MIADLVGSTLQATSVDTVRGAKFLEDATNPIRAAIETQGGRVLKFMGDGFLAVFESARAALVCADSIRDHYIRQHYAPGGFPIDGVRVVVHTADAVLEDDDLIGDPIIVCARLEKSVPTNQVWLTSATKEVVGISDFVFQPVGDIQIKGRPVPVTIYSLENTDLSYIEYGTVLLVTDLHSYRPTSERLTPIKLNEWLSTWVNLQRQAIKGLHGHIRQFVSDLTLITFANAEDALKATLNLQTLCQKHNAEARDMPAYGFKAAIKLGDIILSSNGIVGKLVNDTFDLLDEVPRQTICLDEASYRLLQEESRNLLKPFDLPPAEPVKPTRFYQIAYIEKTSS